MKVRLYEPTDMPKLEALSSSQPFYHALPDVNHSSFISRQTATNGNGEPVAFGFLRIIGEGFMTIDHKWGTPMERWIALQTIHNTLIADGACKCIRIIQRDGKHHKIDGIHRCVTWVPHEIHKPYGRRLESLGWQPQDRASFILEVA